MRRAIRMMEGWQFRGKDGKQQDVNLPHTWNNLDGQDGGNDYYRGTCRYEKTFSAPDFSPEETVYLEFQGVNASAKVELNGRLLGTHDGGYSTFRFSVADLLQDENRLTVYVDNSVNDKVYPQKADFTFYGGIYRDVLLRVVPRIHFDLDHLGAEGIKVTAKPTDGYRNGEVRVETWIGGEISGSKDQACQVKVCILDRDGSSVAQGEGTDVTLALTDVSLWDGVDSPCLYTAAASLYVNGVLTDEVKTRFGVRDFGYDPKNGFSLNGRPYPLRGVSRHQDRKDLGNAITKEMHKEDMDIICEMGVNTLRLAHYQHDQYFYDLCDERGIVVWAEIPYIS